MVNKQSISRSREAYKSHDKWRELVSIRKSQQAKYITLE